MASTGWLAALKGIIVAQPTLQTAFWQSLPGTYIDYYIASPCVFHLAKGAGQYARSPWGTHATVMADLCIRPHAVVIDRMYVSKELPEEIRIPRHQWQRYYDLASPKGMPALPPELQRSSRNTRNMKRLQT